MGAEDTELQLEGDSITDGQGSPCENLKGRSPSEWARDRGGPRRRRPLRFLTRQELLARADPEWLVAGMIPRGGFVLVYGPTGAAKSFLGVDLALALVHGGHWHGARLQVGPVVYIAAEGAAGLKRRVEAWEAHHRREADQEFYSLAKAISFIETEEVDHLLAGLGTLPVYPVAVIVDTLNRCLVGDENSPKDMGRFIAGCDRIRRWFGATVVVIHHTGHNTRAPRGHSSLVCAADTIIKVTKSANSVKLRCEKQKEAPEFADLVFRLVPEGPSCILQATGEKRETQPTMNLKVLENLAAAGKPMRASELRPATGLSERGLRKELRQLLAASLVRDNGEVENSPKRAYSLTAAGRALLHSCATPSTPPDGGDRVPQPARRSELNSAGLRTNSGAR